MRSIYEDKNGIIWFECGRGLSNYDGKEISTYRERNYNATNEWKLNVSDLWFKGDENTAYNKLEGHAGVYQYDRSSFHIPHFQLQQNQGMNSLPGFNTFCKK